MLACVEPRQDRPQQLGACGKHVEIAHSNGNITVNAPVAWTSGAGLTLDAAGNIAINAPITASGSARGLVLDYGQSSTNAAGASYNIAAPVSLPSTSNAAFTTQAGSKGTAMTYKIIDSQTALENIAGTGDYALGADITATGNFVPIGTFSGVFDGVGHTVSNLDITGGSNVGLFSVLAGGGTIRDVALVNETVSGSGYNVGGLVGFNNGGGISASYATGNVSGSYKVGGLVGTNSGGTTNASYWDTNSSGQTGSAGGGQPLH